MKRYLPRVEATEDVRAVMEFVEAVKSSRSMIYIGIDPGQSGAIGFLCDEHVVVVDIPVIKSSFKRTKTRKNQQPGEAKTYRTDAIKTDYNFAAITALFSALEPVRDRVTLALEVAQVQVAGGGPRNSKAVAFAVGYGFGIWGLFLFERGIRHEKVIPSVWKKALGLAGKDKTASLALARTLWPNDDRLRRAKDHNRAEGLLLAHYLRQKRE